MSTWYMAPDGDDGGAGTMAHPFATLARACAAAREARGDRTVVLRGGAYDDAGVTLGPRDAGLLIMSAPGETPVLRGGRPIPGWTCEANGWLSAPVDAAWDFRLLVVNGRLCPRAHWPAAGRLEHESTFPVHWMSSTAGGWERKPTATELTTMRYRDGDLDAGFDVRNAELTLYHCWDESMVGLAAHDPATRTLTFAMPAGHPAGAFADWQPHAKTYEVWNVREGMTAPGQWYLDRTAGRVYYWPLPDEAPETMTALAPTRERIIRIDGTASDPVAEITLRGLTLTVTNTPRQTGGFGAAAFDGALSVDYARDCRFDGLTIENVAGQGMKITHGAGVVIEGGDIHHTGACGVVLRGEDCRLVHSHLHHIGRMYPSGIGLFAGGARQQVLHNDFHHTPYSCIHLSSADSRISRNRFAEFMQTLQDGAAVYVGFAAGIVIDHNVVIGGTNPRSQTHYHAYYIDEQGERCVVEDNLAVDVPWPSHNHMARECAVRRNVFINATDTKLTFMKCERFTLADNVIVSGGALRLSAPAAGLAAQPHNLLYSRTGVIEAETLAVDGYSPESCAPFVPREGTVIAAPEFRDPAHGDYRYQPNSPAARLGLPEIDVADAGV